MADENTPVDVAFKPKKRPVIGRQSEKKEKKNFLGMLRDRIVTVHV